MERGIEMDRGTEIDLERETLVETLRGTWAKKTHTRMYARTHIMKCKDMKGNAYMRYRNKEAFLSASGSIHKTNNERLLWICYC